jgi:hypothetical protein
LAAKLRQYYTYKFTSSRLKNSNWNISLSVSQARRNGELVSIGDSEMLRSLRRIQGKENIDKDIDALFLEKKKIKRNFTPEKAHRLKEIELEIDFLLFCPEIISVVIEDNKHYQYMIDNKFFVNDKPFVRLLCGAGNSRRNTVVFIAEPYLISLQQIMNNDRKDVPITPAKFNAYFALMASATLPVSEPYFCVIKDCLVTRKEKVDFIEEHSPDDFVIEKEMDIEFNLFDGMGTISPRQARIWAEDMELDYTPSAFIIRNAFMKGMVCVMDFHRFSDDIGKHMVEDIWGNQVNIRDMDVIITESQLKLWYAYDSCKDYIDSCHKNKIEWGVSRSTPKVDKRYVFSNYQFLQVLDLNDDQIKSLCQKTVDFFNQTIRTDVSYALLYLLGKNANQEFKADIFDSLHDVVTKALILNNNLLKDPYIQNYLARSLNKKIRESYIGNLLMDGNYQVMISDPYAFMEHMFGLPVNGLLNRGQHYSQYWNKKDIKKVAGCRAPLTWESEVNILSLQQNEEVDYWYQYLNSGIVYNVHGNDVMIQADADFDGDLVMTTDQPEFLDGARGGLPVTYTKNKVGKKNIIESELYQPDMLAFNSRVGYITNCSTTMYAMLPLYHKESSEYKEIINRLKICRKEQGNEIDKAKGLIVKQFPKHWTRYTKKGKKISDEDADFYNSIMVNKRPYFMRWLYSNYSRKYRIFITNYNRFSNVVFKKDISEILNNQNNIFEKEFMEKYTKFIPLLDTSCLVNKVCHYMETKVKELRVGINENNDLDFIKNILQDREYSHSEKYKKDYKDFFDEIYGQYKMNKGKFIDILDDNGESRFKTLDQFNKYLRLEAIKKVTPLLSELATMAVEIGYTMDGDKSFAWNVFGEGIVDNITKNRQENVSVPFLDDKGDIKYLDSNYSLFDIDFEPKVIDINDYI